MVFGTQSWFGLDDLLSSVIPGSVLIAAYLFYFHQSPEIVVQNMTPMLGASLFILAFLLGEGIGFLVGGIQYPPATFHVALNEEHPEDIGYPLRTAVLIKIVHTLGFPLQRFSQLTESKPWLPTLPEPNLKYTSSIRTRTKDKFWPLFKKQFGATNEFQDPRDIFLVLMNTLDGQFNGYMAKYRRMYDFTSNLFGALTLVWFGSIAVVSTYFFDFMTKVRFTVSPIFPILAIFLIPIALYPLIFVQKSFERTFTEHIFIEYFTSQSQEKQKSEESPRPVEMKN